MKELLELNRYLHDFTSAMLRQKGQGPDEPEVPLLLLPDVPEVPVLLVLVLPDVPEVAVVPVPVEPEVLV